MNFKISELEKEICNIFNLEKVRSFKLNLNIGHIPTVLVEFNIKDENLQEIVSILKKYKVKLEEIK